MVHSAWKEEMPALSLLLLFFNTENMWLKSAELDKAGAQREVDAESRAADKSAPDPHKMLFINSSGPSRDPPFIEI
ncbi:hypothetical protein M8494_24355 [Serratia ureilytica]